MSKLKKRTSNRTLGILVVGYRFLPCTADAANKLGPKEE